MWTLQELELGSWKFERFAVRHKEEFVGHDVLDVWILVVGQRPDLVAAIGKDLTHGRVADVRATVLATLAYHWNDPIHPFITTNLKKYSM